MNKGIIAAFAIFSSSVYAGNNYIQTQYYQLPPGIEQSNCQLKIIFSNNVVLGPVSIVVKNAPTYTDNAVIEYLCGKTCEWLETTIQNCDQGIILADTPAKTYLSYNDVDQKYTALPDTVYFKFIKSQSGN